MKNKILSLAKELGLSVEVDVYRRDFDIIDYTVKIGNNQDTFSHFAGKTSTGVTYPTQSILIPIKEFMRSKGKELEFKA